MDKTLYVVSGYMRTGTSMMMKALKAGGLNACYAPSRDKLKELYTDEYYDPNVGGLYELERFNYLEWDFPVKYEGRLIKALNTSVAKMAVMPHGIRVVFMRRNAEEIRQSYSGFFDKQLPSIEDLDRNMNDVIKRIHNRKDVLSIHIFWFRDVVNEPIRHFKYLQNDGWPIDVDKAASIPDEKYCRYKLEELEVGVL